MFSGLTLANVLGVPAGTALGQALGWRAAFWAIVPIGLTAATALVFLIPPQAAGKSDLIREFRVLRRPQVLLGMFMSTLTSASLFCVYTYVAPTLLLITRVSPHGVTLTLLLFGVGITIGNLLGGALSDWRPTAFLVGSLMALIVSLVAALLRGALRHPVHRHDPRLGSHPVRRRSAAPVTRRRPRLRSPKTSPPPSIRERLTSATPPEPLSAASLSPPATATARSPSPASESLSSPSLWPRSPSITNGMANPLQLLCCNSADGLLFRGPCWGAPVRTSVRLQRRTYDRESDKRSDDNAKKNP